MNLVTQAIISGFMTGAVYALMGIGLVIVYRTSRILNLAHGECFAVAGIVAALAATRGLPAWLGLLLAVLEAVSKLLGQPCSSSSSALASFRSRVSKPSVNQL
jgi:branched-subunit amino acid ABC-type transport system permease component